MAILIVGNIFLVESIGSFWSTCYGKIAADGIDARLAESIYPRAARGVSG